MLSSVQVEEDSGFWWIAKHSLLHTVSLKITSLPFSVFSLSEFPVSQS